MNNYETLKQILFRRAKIEYVFYSAMQDNQGGHWTQLEIWHQLRMYLTLWQVIEEAKLEDEFYTWGGEGEAQ